VTGDTCLYENYQLLSGDCQQAIGDVYSLHDQYIAEDEASHHHPHVFGLILLVGVALICCVKRRARRQKIAAVLEAIRQDPELKARVEAATGQPIPEPCCARSKKCGACKVVCKVVLSLLVVFASMRITGCIYGSMIHEDENGDPVGPGPLVFLLLFIAVITVLLGLLAGCCWVGKQLCGGSNSCESGPSSPFPARAQRIVSWGRNLVFRNPDPTAYAPLMTEERDTELSSIPTAKSPPVQAVFVNTVPRMVNAVQIVPAQTYSNVSMI
jgi:hypothetical protein